MRIGSFIRVSSLFIALAAPAFLSGCDDSEDTTSDTVSLNPQ